MRLAIVSALLVSASAHAGAQSAWHDLQVPSAALRVLDIPVDRGRAMAMTRAIRILHSVPRPEIVPSQTAELERVLLDLDLVERQISRNGVRAVNLEMAKSATERIALDDALESVGLRLQERNRAYSVEAKTGNDARSLRERLVRTGIDAGAMQQRINAGETVSIVPEFGAFPLPLAPDTWSRTIFEGTVSPRSLFSGIIRDRRASLLYHGLQSMTPATLAYLTKNTDLLRYFYEDVAGPVGAFGGVFHVGLDGRVIIPGGPDAVELWQALVGEDVGRPGGFGRALFGRDSGRLAYFFNAIARLDEPHRRFALGLWLRDRGVRLERFRALYRTFVGVDPEWDLHKTPFARPPYDPATLLAIVSVDPQGIPQGPTFRKLWARAFDGADLPSVGARVKKDPADDGVIDAAWLAEQLGGLLAGQRHGRIVQMAFGQRVFGRAEPAQLQDVLTGLRGFVRFPAALLALERIGIHDPAVYVQTARRASSLESLEDAAQSVPVLSQFQGAFALLERLARTASVERGALDRLVTSLIALPVTGDGYEGRLAQWVELHLLPSLPDPSGPEVSKEDRLLDALADRASIVMPFEWEGETYSLNRGAALREMKAIRAKQGGNALDAVLAVFAHAHALAEQPQALDQLRLRTTALRADAGRLVPARSWPDAPDAVPQLKKTLDEVIRGLDKVTKAEDLPRVVRIAKPLGELLDYLLGETLVAIAYAPLLGDPKRVPGGGADVSHRHTFGVGSTVGSRELARRTAWLRPRLGSTAIAGEAYTGSLLGLDLAMSGKRLQRLAVDRLPGPPRLNSNDARTYVETLALLNPRELTNPRRDFIGAALARGRERLKAAAADPMAIDELAVEARMGDGRRHLIAWSAANEPEHLERLFSLVELFWLGARLRENDALEDVRAWGMSQEPLSGCYCLGFPDPGAWDMLAGRDATRQLASSVPDVNLRVAEVLFELNVPAPLFPGVLGIAMQEYLDDVSALYNDDWWAIAGHASQLTRERIEDYVSAFVASGPVRHEGAGNAR